MQSVARHCSKFKGLHCRKVEHVLYFQLTPIRRTGVLWNHRAYCELPCSCFQTVLGNTSQSSPVLLMYTNPYIYYVNFVTKAERKNNNNKNYSIKKKIIFAAAAKKTSSALSCPPQYFPCCQWMILVFWVHGKHFVGKWGKSSTVISSSLFHSAFTSYQYGPGQHIVNLLATCAVSFSPTTELCCTGTVKCRYLHGLHFFKNRFNGVLMITELHQFASLISV